MFIQTEKDWTYILFQIGINHFYQIRGFSSSAPKKSFANFIFTECRMVATFNKLISNRKFHLEDWPLI